MIVFVALIALVTVVVTAGVDIKDVLWTIPQNNLTKMSVMPLVEDVAVFNAAKNINKRRHLACDSRNFIAVHDMIQYGPHRKFLAGVYCCASFLNLFYGNSKVNVAWQR